MRSRRPLVGRGLGCGTGSACTSDDFIDGALGVIAAVDVDDTAGHPTLALLVQGHGQPAREVEAALAPGGIGANLNCRDSKPALSAGRGRPHPGRGRCGCHLHESPPPPRRPLPRRRSRLAAEQPCLATAAAPVDEHDGVLTAEGSLGGSGADKVMPEGHRGRFGIGRASRPTVEDKIHRVAAAQARGGPHIAARQLDQWRADLALAHADQVRCGLHSSLALG